MRLMEIAAAHMLEGGQKQINMNSVAVTELFKVPQKLSNGNDVTYCMVWAVMAFKPSVSLTTVSFGFGFDASGIDCKATATHTELDGSTKYKIILMKDGAVLGDPGDSFSIGVTIAQGAAATCEFIPIGIIV